jgi:DNA-binding NtrC family response regulator
LGDEGLPDIDLPADAIDAGTAFIVPPKAPAGGKAAAEFPAGMPLAEVERRMIFRTLNAVDNNRTRAAEMLGISIRTLRNKLKEYREALGITPDNCTGS